MKKAKLLSAVCVAYSVFMSSVALAQTTINVASHSATINGMQYDYSIGEMTLISTQKSTNIIVTQGFLQPTKSNTSSNQESNNGFADFASIVKVYPTPTDNLIFIESSEAFNDSFQFQLIDASGKVILSNEKATQLNQQKWSMNLSALASGNYFIIMQQYDAKGNKQHSSFKIQKLN
jgi:hypothetical protein